MMSISTIYSRQPWRRRSFDTAHVISISAIISVSLTTIIFALYMHGNLRLKSENAVPYEATSTALEKVLIDSLDWNNTELPVSRDKVRKLISTSQRSWKRGKKKLYILHIHKGGGTTLCTFFSESGIHIDQTNNCNGNQEMSYAVQHNTTELLNILTKGRYQAVFNEQGIHHPLLESEFIYITTIRDPIERHLSQMMHAWNLMPLLQNGTVKFKIKSNQTLVDGSEIVEKWLVIGEEYMPNYETSVFIDKQPTTIRDMTDAIHYLSKFTLVIPTDELNDGLFRLSKLLSMNPTQDQMDIEMRGGSLGKTTEIVNILRSQNPSLYDRLVDENSFDLLLYQFSKGIYGVQRQFL